ncbi:MAG: carboxylating nicotinate-nucleotide diphosphorylase [Micromonosporaceae bacterium]
MKQPTAANLTTDHLDPRAVERIVRAALEEDLGGPDGVDVTSAATVAEEARDTAELVARADGVLAGMSVAAAVFDLAAEAAGVGAVKFDPLRQDGDAVRRGDVLAVVEGPTRSLLTAERTALNLLCRISGVATATARWAQELRGTGAQVLDTRKTTPGLRLLEKYAVRVGGGGNKRMGLHDVAMVKDNHKLAAGGVGAAYRRVREAYPEVPVEVEVTTVDEALEAVDAGADFLLCDNMTPEQLRNVVEQVAGRAKLEATGGLTLSRARAYAETGVDFISVGALTHSAPILDIALDLRPRKPDQPIASEAATGE